MKGFLAPISWDFSNCNNKKFVEVQCLSCGKAIKTTQKWAKFCDYNCDMRYRRTQNKYYIEENCPICNRIFEKFKFSRTRFCSISCGAKNSASSRKKTVN